jgi:hypothetical protein
MVCLVLAFDMGINGDLTDLKVYVWIGRVRATVLGPSIRSQICVL